MMQYNVRTALSCTAASSFDIVLNMSFTHFASLLDAALISAVNPSYSYERNHFQMKHHHHHQRRRRRRRSKNACKGWTCEYVVVFGGKEEETQEEKEREREREKDGARDETRDETYAVLVSRSVRSEFDKTLHFGWTSTRAITHFIKQLRASKRIDVNQTLERARARARESEAYVERRN